MSKQKIESGPIPAESLKQAGKTKPCLSEEWSFVVHLVSQSFPDPCMVSIIASLGDRCLEVNPNSTNLQLPS